MKKFLYYSIHNNRFPAEYKQTTPPYTACPWRIVYLYIDFMDIDFMDPIRKKIDLPY